MGWGPSLESPEKTGAEYPGTTLEQLHVEAWRLFFAGAGAAGRTIDRAIPRLFADLDAAVLRDALEEAPEGGDPAGLVASALVEFTVDHVLRAEVVGPAVEGGAVALSNPFGFMNVSHVLGLAGKSPDGPAAIPDDTLQGLLRSVRASYSSSYLQPTLGILLDADPERADSPRVAKDGAARGVGDRAAADRLDRACLHAFDTRTAEECRAAAQDWGWSTVSADGGSEEVAARVRDLVLSHPALSG
ncbi:hypothetical protein [Streptomyces sp. NRRL F-5123]|uniref:hypothetical protein n=1 Tax=Streptomyces sp. NRRL F-5123 TaxID=1463856 RepID=UPI0004E111B6|nr:hypothetical protein [Streptomyces sp. NRRL F-5123]